MSVEDMEHWVALLRSLHGQFAQYAERTQQTVFQTPQQAIKVRREYCESIDQWMALVEFMRLRMADIKKRMERQIQNLPS